MHRPVHALLHRQGALEQHHALVETFLIDQRAPEHCHTGRGAEVVVAVERHQDLDRLSIERLGLGVAAAVVLRGAEVD